MIAWRMQDKGFFTKALDLLRRRHVYQDTLWSYGILHNDPAAVREYLPHTPVRRPCGPYFDAPLLTSTRSNAGPTSTSSTARWSTRAPTRWAGNARSSTTASANSTSG